MLATAAPPAADEAYDHLGDTYSYYQAIHDRRSIDDAGMPPRGVVHFGNDYDNAFWDGKRMCSATVTARCSCVSRARSTSSGTSSSTA